MLGTIVSLPTSAFPPLALGFMGLGTGYLIYGPQELFHYPKRSPDVDFATGVWGMWLPGFFQFVAGVILFAGLTLFGTLKTPTLYMAALAFTSYGIHWFAMGWNRARSGSDSRVNLGMAVGFTVISALGVVVFFASHNDPVGGIFIGLVCVYLADILASLKPDLPKAGAIGERALGFFHLGTGIWLLYMMFAVTVDFAVGYHWLV